MQIKKNLNSLDKLYIIFFSIVLFLNIFIPTSLSANLFEITNVEIKEPFELNFNKEKVINNGFKKAFIRLISVITILDDKKKIKNTSLSTIKRLVDSFTISNETFINNEYHVKYDVNFSKKKTLEFLESKNIFPSIPKKKKILLIPLLVDEQLDKILFHSDNILYKKWNEKNEKYFLLSYILPNEDLEDINILSQKILSIEDYDFKEIINKYDINDYIVTIIYKNNEELRILSKIKLNKFFKIDNKKFEDIDLTNEKNINFVLSSLKNTYENYWKKINQINTSIKLPITISIDSKSYKKIENFEKILDEADLVSHVEILRFDSQNVYYKIIYNGSPQIFLNDMKNKKIKILTQNQVWQVQ